MKSGLAWLETERPQTPHQHLSPQDVIRMSGLNCITLIHRIHFTNDPVVFQVDGKLVELSAHHTASRIIQFCARHGTPEQRTRILEQVGCPNNLHGGTGRMRLTEKTFECWDKDEQRVCWCACPDSITCQRHGKHAGFCRRTRPPLPSPN